MDPSYNDNLGGSNSDRQPQQPIASQPTTPQPVVPQPITPQPMVQRPIMARRRPTVSRRSMGQQNMMVQQPMEQQPMMTQQPMAPQQPMMAQQPAPVSSGTGDIVLAQDKKPRKKLGLIIAIALGVVGAIVLMVVVLSKSGVVEIVPTNTGLRGAFNQYANYFLTGETSTKDIEIPDGNNEAGDSLLGESDESTVSGEDSEEDVNESYEARAFFILTAMADYDNEKEYIENTANYFTSFKDYYLREMGSYGEAEELLNDYENKLDTVLLSRSSGKLTRNEILEAFLQDGDNGAKELINDTANVYENLTDINGINYGNLVSKYGQQELELIKKYKEHDCIQGGEIDYECVSNLSNDESLGEIDSLVYEYAGEMRSVIDDCNMELYSGIYTFANIIYNKAEIIEELKNEE